ncbi:MAG: anti-sigma factor antagonist [Planctomycetes bacterium]|nr:anti-sigma factor antagonist [Planctomycetota bacterium]
MERATQTFASDVQQLVGIRTFVRSACERAWGAGHEEIAHLELALAEAAANVMLHAYEGEAGRPIEVLVEAGPEEVRVWLYHEGRDFDPAAVAPPVFDGSRESGFGMYLIKQAVEEAAFFSDDNGRRVVRLVKKRRPAQPAGGTMQTEVEQVGDVTVVAINAQELDAGNDQDFRQVLAPVLKDCRKLVVDLGRVQFVDSRGCGAILSCLKQVRSNGGDLKLCCITKFVRSTFNLMRFHRLCDLLDTREEAVQAFQQAT